MATNRFRGDAPPVAQVDTLTVGGTVEIGDLFKITINNKTLTVPATTTSLTTTASEIATAFNALSSTQYPEFAEITAAATSGGDLTLTAETAGVPFDVSVATTEANGSAADAQTFTKASTTASSGPNHWDDPLNWTLGVVPVSTDDVIIENSTVDILYGLAQSAVTLNSLTIMPTYTGKIGLPNWNSHGYYEYRGTYLNVKSTTLRLADGAGNGSGRIKINTDSAACTLLVQQTGNSIEAGIPAFIWKGTSASNALTLTKGSMGVAIFAGETANLSGGVNMGYQGNVATDANLKLGSGVTLATINKEGGVLEVNSNVTTLVQNEGTTTVNGGTMTTLTARGGTVYWNGTGTLTTGSLSGKAILDYSRDPRAKTVTNPIEIYGDEAKLIDPFKVIASLIVDMNEARTLANLDLGRNVRITRGTPA